VREDRHGRASGSDNDRRRRPAHGFRTRDVSRFTALAKEALRELPDELLSAVAGADVIVEEVPPEPTVARPGVPLAAVRMMPAPPRVTVYRRPLESRASDRMELADLLRAAIGREVAAVLGVDTTDWDDPDFD